MNRAMAEDALAKYKVPPHNLEAEQSVLGAVLIQNEALYKIIDVLTAQDFYLNAHQRIFSVIQEMERRKDPVDVLTLSNALKNRNQLEEIGGLSYLATLVENVPTAANVNAYAQIVKEKSLVRQLLTTVTDIAGNCYDHYGDIQEFLNQSESRIFSVTEQQIKGSAVSMEEVVKQAFKKVQLLYERKELVTGVPSGYVELDKLTAGFQDSELIVVAGRPGMGKTAFGLNVATHAALDGQVPVAIFSLEMSRAELGMRLLCTEAKVSSQVVRTGHFSSKEWTRLTRAAGTLSEAPIYIDDTPAISVLELQTKARRLKAEHKIGMVFVDYLQLMRGSQRTDLREQEIAEISRSLKAMAKELSLPVMTVSQLNRAVEGRDNKRPRLSDLRESGAIEQDADVIIFLYRDDYYNREAEEKGKTEVDVAKQRNGPVGKVDLFFQEEYTRFENFSYQEQK